MSDLIQIGIDVNTNIKQATADLDKMGGSVVSNIRTIDRLESEVKQLNNALSKGSATEAAYAKGIRQINNELSIFQQRASKAAKVEKRFGTAAATGGKSMNRFNVALQQGGFQLQDFAVQMQSGTSFFTAFAQQGSQFAGIFGPTGAVIGAIIAVGSALAGMAVNTLMAGKELRDYEELVKGTTDALEELTKATSVASMSNKELEESFGSASVEIKGTLALLRDIAKNEAQRAIDSLSDSLVELYQVAGAGDKRLGIAEFFDVNIMVAFTRSGKQAVKEARLLTGEFLGAQNALAASKGNLEGQIDATQRLINSAETLADLDGERNQEEEGLIKKLGESLLKMQEAQTIKTNTLSTHRDILGTEEGLALETEALNKLFEDRLGTIDDTANLYEDILGSSKGLSQAEEALNKLYEDRLGTIDDTANEYVDVLGSEKGLSAAVVGTNKFYESRLGTIDDTANEYVDVLGTEEGLGKYVDALNQMYQDRLDKLQDMADAYDDILGSEEGLAKAEAARLALTQVGDSGYAGGRGGDPRDFTYLDEFRNQLNNVTKETKKLKKGMTDAEIAAERLRKELQEPMVNAIGSVSNAFGDFIANGLKDFKGFASSILDSFKGMIAQMIATAARNKIMLSMGMSGNGGGSVASQAGGSIIGGMAKSAFGSILQGGFTGASAFGHGITTSLGLGSTINGTVASVLSPTMASVGSIVGSLAGPLLAVGAAFSFLRTRTKELDSGLRVTVDNMDVLVKSFKTIQKSRFFGLSKKVRTSEEEASSDISDPIVDAVFTIQESVMEAASAFGVASDKFNDFTYDFEVSLKGLTEDQKMEKLNEEFTKLGDTFTEMSGLFTSMNDLLAVYQQRLELEKQLLVAQGDVVKLREQELETIHVLNRDLATRLHLLQAEGDTQSALTAFASGISEQQGLIRRAVDALVKPLQDAIDRTRTQAEKSYSIFKTAADKSADSAKNIVDIITSALDSRTIISESAELMRYQTAQKQLASFAGGAEFDEASLRKATEGVSIDSQKFFGSFEDYARDFYRTQINLEDLAAVAEKELSDVEQQIDIAQKAYEVAMGTHQEAVDLNTAIETLAKDLNVYEATKLANEPLIKMVQDEGDRQIELLDSILVETTKQVNTQLGIESSMADLVGNTVSIGEAMGVLGLEAESLAGGVLALKDIEKDINGNVTNLGLYVVDFDGSVKKLDTSVFDLTDTAEDIDGTVDDFDGTVDDLDGDVEKLFKSINLLDGGIDDFGVKVAGLGVSTDDLGIDITSLGDTLSSAMSGLGSIVGSLTEAVNSLASSNNSLAAAQQKASSASKIATITTEAAGISAEISSIESSRGTTATGPSDAQKSQLAKLQQDLIDEENSDDRNLGTAHFENKIAELNKKIAEQSVPAELSPGTSLALAALSGALDTLRKEVTDLGGTATFATGGYHSGGMRLVGENGPELEATGPSRIYSAQQTKNMLSGGSGEVVVELRSLRREVSELKAEQRKVGVENVKYNKKSYDLYREWDTVGLPATRTA